MYPDRWKLPRIFSWAKRIIGDHKRPIFIILSPTIPPKSTKIWTSIYLDILGKNNIFGHDFGFLIHFSFFCWFVFLFIEFGSSFVDLLSIFVQFWLIFNHVWVCFLPGMSNFVVFCSILLNLDRSLLLFCQFAEDFGWFGLILDSLLPIWAKPFDLISGEFVADFKQVFSNVLSKFLYLPDCNRFLSILHGLVLFIVDFRLKGQFLLSNNRFWPIFLNFCRFLIYFCQNWV